MDERPRFDGDDYVPARDDRRLTSQLGRIKTLMLDGQWRTLHEIEAITGDPPASISAQLRHLRKRRFGSYIMNRRYVGGGLYQYQILEPEERWRCVVCRMELDSPPDTALLSGYGEGFCPTCKKRTTWGT